MQDLPESSSLDPLFGSSSSLFSYFFNCRLFVFFLVPASFYHCIFVRVASLFIDNNNVHFTVWFWGSQEGRGGCTQPSAPPGVPLYLCVRDACDIAVDEVIKEVNTYSRCRESASSAFITFFLCPEEYNKAPFWCTCAGEHLNKWTVFVQKEKMEKKKHRQTVLLSCVSFPLMWQLTDPQRVEAPMWVQIMQGGYSS